MILRKGINMVYVSNSEQETLEIAQSFSMNLNYKDVVVLSGELGAGKTRFMYGIAKYFGIEDQICSPTFTIVNEYKVSNMKNNIDKIFHFDVYRISDSEEFEDTIGLDYFSQGLCIIEWGKNIQDILPSNTYYIDIQKDDENQNTRKIYIRQGKDK